MSDPKSKSNETFDPTDNRVTRMIKTGRKPYCNCYLQHMLFGVPAQGSHAGSSANKSHKPDGQEGNNSMGNKIG